MAERVEQPERGRVGHVALADLFLPLLERHRFDLARAAPALRPPCVVVNRIECHRRAWMLKNDCHFAILPCVLTIALYVPLAGLRAFNNLRAKTLYKGIQNGGLL